MMAANNATEDIAQPISVMLLRISSWVSERAVSWTSIRMAKLVRWEQAQLVWVRFVHATWQPSDDQPLWK